MRLRFSIAGKYAALVAGAVLLLAGMLAWLLQDLMSQALRAELIKRGQGVARHLATLTAPLLLSRDEAKIGAALNNIVKDPDLSAASVLDTDGVIVADSQSGRSGRRLSEAERQSLPAVRTFRLPETADSDIVFVEPSMFGGVQVGTVTITMNQYGLVLSMRQFGLRLILTTAAVALFVLLLGMLALRRTLSPLQQVILGTARIASGDFDFRLRLQSRDEIGDLAQAFNAMAARTGLFFRYLDKGIAERLARDESLARPGGVQKPISVLFGDMRGFTPLSNQHPASEVVAILNTYFDLFFRLIHAFDGVVDKTVGDSVMAFFESSRTTDLSHARQATMAAVAMRAGVKTLSRTLGRVRDQGIGTGFLQQEFGFTVATGRLIAGNIGSERHLNYTVCGPAVNLAARLQAEAGPGEVVLDRFTAMDVEDLVETQALEPVCPKGFSENQKVTPFAVLALRPTEVRRIQAVVASAFDEAYFRAHLGILVGRPEGIGEPAEHTRLAATLYAIHREVAANELTGILERPFRARPE